MTYLNPGTGPYMGDSDVALLAWLDNFDAKVAADPVALGLTIADAMKLTALADAYSEAFVQAKNPTVRTPPITVIKDTARREAEAFGRSLAMRIKTNPGVTDEQRAILQIHIDDPIRTPIGTPMTAPHLRIISSAPGTHTIRFADSETPYSPRKPKGVTHLLLLAEFAAHPTGDPDALRFVAAATRNPHLVHFDNGQHAGKVAVYYGRWLTAKGLLGPFSAPVSMVVPYSAACAPAACRTDHRADREPSLAA